MAAGRLFLAELDRLVAAKKDFALGRGQKLGFTHRPRQKESGQNRGSP
jgi:hypothetical protein